MNKTLALLLTLGLALTSGAAQRQTLKHKHVPDAVARLTPIGDLEPTNRLHLSISLPLRNQPQLDALMADLYNPTSPNYRHWLTNGEFASRFGPTTNDYEAAASWAQSQGFTISTRHSSRHLLGVDGSTLLIEKAFSVKMKKYRHPKENRTFFSADREPTTDCPVDISFIEGLNTYSLPKSNSHKSNWTANNGTAPGGQGYWRMDYQKAYFGTTNYTGTNQNIGSVQLAEWWDSDIQSYTGDPSITNRIHRVVVSGPMSAPDVESSIEPSLDIEMQWCMSPQANFYVYLYQPDSGLFWTTIFEQIVTDNSCKQISSSYSGGTGPVTDWFSQMAAQGQTFFWASGDRGAIELGGVWDYTQNDHTTQVGATSLNTDLSGLYISETGLALSTGGMNPNEPCPDWQLPIFYTVPLGTCPGTSACRMIPDVSAVGSMAYILFGNGFGGPIEGTSVGAPMWAGLMANVNNAAGTNGPVGDINPRLYQIATNSFLYSFSLHDVTTGNNTNSNSDCGYYAAVGYDLVTGLGSPNSNLITYLANINSISLVFSNGLFIKATSP